MAKFELPAEYNKPTGWFGGHLFVEGVCEVNAAQAEAAGIHLKRFYAVTEVGAAPPPPPPEEDEEVVEDKPKAGKKK